MQTELYRHFDADALAQACDIMGRADTEIERARMRNALNKHLGTRRAPKPWINTPAKEGRDG